MHLHPVTDGIDIRQHVEPHLIAIGAIHTVRQRNGKTVERGQHTLQRLERHSASSRFVAIDRQHDAPTRTPRGHDAGE
jgi:hypothetical protein